MAVRSMRSIARPRAPRRSARRSTVAWRRVCVPAAAISGAMATRDWLSSASWEAATRFGRLVAAIWLKLAPKRATAKIATPLWVSASKPIRTSPSRTVSATPLRRRAQARVGFLVPRAIRERSTGTTRSMRGPELGEDGVRGEFITLHRGVPRLAEPREVDLAPVHAADLGKAARHRQVDGAHRRLQAHVLFGEVAAVVMVAQHDHGPRAEQEAAAMRDHHPAVKHLIDRVLAPI